MVLVTEPVSRVPSEHHTLATKRHASERLSTLQKLQTYPGSPSFPIPDPLLFRRPIAAPMTDIFFSFIARNDWLISIVPKETYLKSFTLF